MYQHILLPFDNSELSQKAVKQGIALAKSTGAKITVITVIVPFHTGITSPVTSEIVHEFEHGRDEEAKKKVAKLHADIASRAKTDGVKCESVIALGGNPYEEIIAKAKKLKCDLIVMASHGRRGLDALLLGSETAKVLTHSKIPVLVVR
jgi:nucleotide-binding universal stress UspA family protein